jgi:NADH-quinone oxidoreductase subunit J
MDSPAVSMVEQIIFFLFAVTAIAAALGMLLARNPVTAALWLVLNLFCVAGLYLTLHAQFIAVIQVLVYAGAIMVLFLFVIMLLNLAEIPRPQEVHWGKVFAFAGGMGFLAVLMYVIAMSLDVLPQPVDAVVAAETGTANNIARELFTRYLLPFEIIGVLLLVATIGAVMFAKKRFA